MKTPLALTFLISAGFLARGDIIPYPNAGTIAPTVPLFAAQTGDVDAYFYGFSAADTDAIQMCDVTLGTCTAFALTNQTTTVGSMEDFGLVNAGDVLVFNLENITTGTLLSSDPTVSADGINHAYITPYTATGSTAIPTIPAGTFVGMEDLSLSQGSDLDYNDDQFVISNLSMNQVPEPSSAILCLGLLALLPIARRKFGL
jgi:hypothetical protein